MHILENEKKKIKNLWASCFTLDVTTRIIEETHKTRGILRGNYNKYVIESFNTPWKLVK